MENLKQEKLQMFQNGRQMSGDQCLKIQNGHLMSGDKCLKIQNGR